MASMEMELAMAQDIGHWTTDIGHKAQGIGYWARMSKKARTVWHSVISVFPGHFLTERVARALNLHRGFHL